MRNFSNGVYFLSPLRYNSEHEKIKSKNSIFVAYFFHIFDRLLDYFWRQWALETQESRAGERAS